MPSDNPDLSLGKTDASASPLVIVAKLAGVKVLPDIINAVLLTAVLSAANSNVYSGSRILVALANEKHFQWGGHGTISRASRSSRRPPRPAADPVV